MSITGVSLVLTRSAIFWWRDLDTAYHQHLLSGCGRPWLLIKRWILSQSGKESKAMDSRCDGCDPSSCGGSCHKSMAGVCLSGHVMSFAGPQFRGKLSHAPLVVVTDHFIRYIMRMIDIQGAAYVDDLFLALLAAWHGACAGLSGGCALCQENLERPRAQEPWVDMVMQELQLKCSNKRGRAGQGEVLMGVMMDTFLGRMLVTAEKLAKLMLGLHSLLTAG